MFAVWVYGLSMGFWVPELQGNSLGSVGCLPENAIHVFLLLCVYTKVESEIYDSTRRRLFPPLRIESVSEESRNSRGARWLRPASVGFYLYFYFGLEVTLLSDIPNTCHEKARKFRIVGRVAKDDVQDLYLYPCWAEICCEIRYDTIGSCPNNDSCLSCCQLVKD